MRTGISPCGPGSLRFSTLGSSSTEVRSDVRLRMLARASSTDCELSVGAPGADSMLMSIWTSSSSGIDPPGRAVGRSPEYGRGRLLLSIRARHHLVAGRDPGHLHALGGEDR